jgi:hypothetical protein
LHHEAKVGDCLPLGAIQLVVDGIAKDRVTTVGLDLAETPEELAPELLRMRITAGTVAHPDQAVLQARICSPAPQLVVASPRWIDDRSK